MEDVNGNEQIRAKMVEAHYKMEDQKAEDALLNRLNEYEASSSNSSNRSTVMKTMDIIVIIAILSAFLISIYRIKEKPNNLFETIVGLLVSLLGGSIYFTLFT